ncbi:MAG: prepilin-type N-terminal cleavage/methylation domain-containing protein [Quadrisphaera sp.]
MLTDRRPQTPRHGDEAFDEGYTLVEVMIAVVLAGVIVLGGAMFVITGVDRSAAVQRQQTGPVLANQAMDLARAVTPTRVLGPTGDVLLLTGLVKGRSSADVAAQWSSSDVPDRSSNLAALRPGAVAGSAQAVLPLQTSVQVGSSTYTVVTWSVPATPPRAGGACTTNAAGLSAPPTADHLRMVRVVVQVSWPATAASSCTGARCTYSTSTLVDPHGDLLWNASPLGSPP